MSMKPQYETYRHVGEVCRLKSQSIVECRLNGSEIGSVLAVQAKAVPIECSCADGEVRYNGKLFFCIVYEDAERKICRAERGVEFFHKAEGEQVTPACFAKILLSVENVSHRREGSGLYISAVVGAETPVYGGKQIEYLIGGEDVETKRETVQLCKTVCVSGETEAEDEFETDEVGDVLLHNENALVTSVSVSGGELVVEGELALNVCALKNDESLCSYERLLPFKIQIPSEEAFGNVSATARVCVKNAQLTATVDEGKGKSKIVFAYTLFADCFLSIKDEISVATDAFSTACETTLKYANDGGRYLTSQTKRVERVSGAAVVTPPIDGECFLQAAVLPRAEISCKKTENGMEIEGCVLAELLLREEDGGCQSRSLSLPFSIPIAAQEGEIEVDCVACGLTVRHKKESGTEAEATLKLCIKHYERYAWRYATELIEGEPYEETDAAISIFLPAAGEDLWQVAKRLRQSPEALKNSNPDLEFPVREGERIFVYRQIK